MRPNPYTTSSAVLLALITLLLQGCSADDPLATGGDPERADTAVNAEVRQLVLESYVYTEQNASDHTIEQTVRDQIRTAFGALRSARISVDDKEMQQNVDPSTFVSEPVEVVRGSGETVEVVETIKRVRYTYQARVLVDKARAARQTFSFALLMGDYQRFAQEIAAPCTEDALHQEWADTFWYVWAPTMPACQALIAEESRTIQRSREGLTTQQISEAEHRRRYLPLTAQLEPVAQPETTFPEYHQLYGLGDPSKDRIVIYQVVGLGDHGGDKIDPAFPESIKFLRDLIEKWPSLKVAKDSPGDPLSFSFNGRDYRAATFTELFDWVLNKCNYPWGISYNERSSFRRAYFEHIREKWIHLEMPLEVSSGPTTKRISLELRLLAGVGSGYQTQQIFREAFGQGDLVLYHGHSYLGSGPLDPDNYKPSDFSDRYQIFFFNSCVSFAYYGNDYFSIKPGGSKNLELITNGLEAEYKLGGKALARFLVALFDGQQHSWRQVIEMSLAKEALGGVHDPNRNVDGEQDNVYDPTETPLSVSFLAE